MSGLTVEQLGRSAHKAYAKEIQRQGGANAQAVVDYDNLDEPQKAAWTEAARQVVSEAALWSPKP